MQLNLSKIKADKNFTYLVIITLFGGILRFFDLGQESFWYDELIMARLTILDFSELTLQLYETGRPPLYIFLSQIWVTFFGNSEVLTRSFSALIGTISIPILFVIAKRLFDSRTGLISAIIMSVSLFHLYHSQEHRYYALLIFFTLLSILFLLQAYDKGNIKGFLLHSFFTAAIFYTHTLAGILFYLSVLIFIFIEWAIFKVNSKKLLISNILYVVSISFWFIPLYNNIFGTTAKEILPWVINPKLISPLETLFTFLVGRFWHFELITIISFSLILGIIIWRLINIKRTKEWIFSIGLLYQKILSAFKSKRVEYKLLLCLIGIPIITLFIVSLVVKPIYVDRYLSISAPAWYILLAYILIKIDKVLKLYLTLGAYIIAIGIAMYFYYTFPTKDQWREAAEYLNKNRKIGEAVVFAVENGNMLHTEVVRDNFSWYYSGKNDGYIIDLTLEETKLIEEFESIKEKSNKFWLVQRDWNGIIPKGLERILKDYSHSIDLETTQKFHWVNIYRFKFVE